MHAKTPPFLFFVLFVTIFINTGTTSILRIITSFSRDIGNLPQIKENGKSGGHKKHTAERVKITACSHSNRVWVACSLGYIFREENHTTMRVIYSTRNVEIPAGG